MKHLRDPYLLLLVVLALLIEMIVFPNIFFHPNSAMMSVEGDGLKNYFSVDYYLLYNTGLKFTGMNYPFGEHLSFADAQVGLALPFKWLSYLFPALNGYGIALVNCSMLAGILLTVIFLYLLLWEHHVSPGISVAAALLIAFFSPQLFRLSAHYALSYAFTLPMMWYLLLRLLRTSSIKYALLLAGTMVFAGLLHFYLAVIAALFLILLIMLEAVTNLRKLHYGRLLIQVAAVVLPVIVLQGFVRWTDWVDDRPANPWGFFYAIAEMSTVFLPHPSDLLGNAERSLPGYGEGFSYAGAAVYLAALVIALVLLFQWLKPRDKRFVIFKRTEWSTLLTAVLVLLFSMCIPFRWMPELLDVMLQPLKQFRSLGRFAWVFYNVIAVLTVVGFYRIHAQSIEAARRVWAIVGVSLIGLAAAETAGRLNTLHSLQQHARGHYIRYSGSEIKNALAKAGYYTSDFQGILTLPFFHVGSEKFSIENGYSQMHAMRTARQTGLPLLNVMMSRTSLQQSLHTVQLLSNSAIDKPLARQLSSGKPLLLMVCGTAFNSAEQAVISKAEYICSIADVQLYKLMPQRLYKDAFDEAMRISQRQQITADGKFITQGADTLAMRMQTADSFADDQANVAADSPVTEVFNEAIPFVKPGDTLLFSCWLQIDPLASYLPFIKAMQSVSAKETAYAEWPFKYSTEVIGTFVMVRGEMVVKEAGENFELKLSDAAHVSHLLIQRKGVNVAWKDNGTQYRLNNIPVLRKSSVSTTR